MEGLSSLQLYIAGIAAAYYDTRIGQAMFVLVALIWLVPDGRIERAVAK